MENKDKIEIPFGAKDSELYECEYTIPEGYEAEIKDGKVIIIKKESEDEKIRKEIIDFIKSRGGFKGDWIAWLEKQGEQKPAWSEEDENGLGDALWAIEQARTIAKDENDMGNLWYAEHWLKSLKDRYTWKPSDESFNNTSCTCLSKKEAESKVWKQ